MATAPKKAAAKPAAKKPAAKAAAKPAAKKPVAKAAAKPAATTSEPAEEKKREPRPPKVNVLHSSIDVYSSKVQISFFRCVSAFVSLSSQRRHTNVYTYVF